MLGRPHPHLLAPAHPRRVRTCTPSLRPLISTHAGGAAIHARHRPAAAGARRAPRGRYHRAGLAGQHRRPRPAPARVARAGRVRRFQPLRGGHRGGRRGCAARRARSAVSGKRTMLRARWLERSPAVVVPLRAGCSPYLHRPGWRWAWRTMCRTILRRAAVKCTAHRLAHAAAPLCTSGRVALRACGVSIGSLLCMSVAAQQGAGATKGCWLNQATLELRTRGQYAAQASTLTSGTKWYARANGLATDTRAWPLWRWPAQILTRTSTSQSKHATSYARPGPGQWRNWRTPPPTTFYPAPPPPMTFQRAGQAGRRAARQPQTADSARMAGRAAWLPCGRRRSPAFPARCWARARHALAFLSGLSSSEAAWTG